ncbi:MAG: aminopeptidase [Anaerovoracaceae bacterium]|jgi:2,5-dihydroxypyridine 5,6-dioxygenase
MFTIELQKSTDILIKEIFKVKKGESVVITADTISDEDVIEATASSVYAAGGIPMIVITPTTKEFGEAADPELPVGPLAAALENCDVWIEYNGKGLLYSTPFVRAEANNKKIRYMDLQGYDQELMIRTVGSLDLIPLQKFMKAVAQKTREAKEMKVTNPAGTDVSFLIEPKHLVSCDCGEADVPGIHMMIGQINVVPKFGSINGTIVFDGTLTPPYGRKVTAPVKLTIENSVITKIEGNEDAAGFEKWLKSFDDEGMFKLAHLAYGFNPGAKLTGNIVEDERVWGSTEWGIGYVSPYDAPPAGQAAKSHTDGICLDSSVWLDGKQIMDQGVIIDPELNALYQKK